MKLGTQVVLGPSHIVLDGDPAPPPPNGHSPPIFGPYQVRPNGCMDQDVTWYGARPRSRRLCVRWGPPLPLPQKGGGEILGPCLLWPNGWMDQDGTWTTWCGGRPQPRGLCVRWGPSPLYFRPMFIIVIVISLEHCTGVRRYCVFKFKFKFSILCILFFGRPFVKRSALCYRTVVLSGCLSVLCCL